MVPLLEEHIALQSNLRQDMKWMTFRVKRPVLRVCDYHCP